MTLGHGPCRECAGCREVDSFGEVRRIRRVNTITRKIDLPLYEIVDRELIRFPDRVTIVLIEPVHEDDVVEVTERCEGEVK